MGEASVKRCLTWVDGWTVALIVVCWEVAVASVFVGFSVTLSLGVTVVTADWVVAAIRWVAVDRAVGRWVGGGLILVLTVAPGF